MKNNILLIIAVTIISMGIIAAVIVLSTVGKGSDESSGSSSSTVQTTSVPETESTESVSEPEVTVTSESETSESQPAEDEASEPVAPEAEGLIATAESLIGVPFVDGGDAPDGFDNSGFIYYVLRQNGYITCPRDIAGQTQIGTALDYDELKSGDLVFFMNDGSTAAGFGGIYTGNGTMIACLMPGTNVREVDISGSYYREHFYCGVSLS